MAAPTAVPYVGARVLNRGIETWEFGIRSYAGSAGDPLALLRCRGRGSILFSAARSAPSTESYERLAHWMTVLYGYFVDLGVPRMEAPQREYFEAFAGAIAPAASEFDRITRELLLPAIDATERLVTVDGGGELREMPGGGKLPRTLRFPRPALVIQAHDTNSLVQAFAGYRNVINGLLADFAKRAGLREESAVNADDREREADRCTV